MGGRVLEYEAKTIYREGWLSGEAQGEVQGEARGEIKGKMTTLIKLVTKGLLTMEEAAEEADMTLDKFKEAFYCENIE